MADSAFKAKIRDLLRSTYFNDPDDAVSVSDSEDVEDNVHVVVISPKFRGKRLGEKTDLILSQLTGSLRPEDWGRVSLSIGVTPEELKLI